MAESMPPPPPRLGAGQERPSPVGYLREEQQRLREFNAAAEARRQADKAERLQRELETLRNGGMAPRDTSEEALAAEAAIREAERARRAAEEKARAEAQGFGREAEEARATKREEIARLKREAAAFDEAKQREAAAERAKRRRGEGAGRATEQRDTDADADDESGGDNPFGKFFGGLFDGK